MSAAPVVRPREVENAESPPRIGAPLTLVGPPSSPAAERRTPPSARSPIALRVADALLSPLTAGAALWLKFVRRAGVHRMPIARETLRWIGVFPVRDHYYEPLFDPRHLHQPLDAIRDLPGIDLNLPEQLSLLESFDYQNELLGFPIRGATAGQFHYDNGAFESGDAEMLYSFIRHFQPRRIFEIGSGSSTLIAAAAVSRNRELDRSYDCDHLCIEPYEAPWLETSGVRVLRERVESLDPELFTALDRNDLLFIDSSHIIRPQGDVLFEYLQILPRLRSGVLVHIHDIFTPRDLREDWIRERVRFWNEQYLLEAFLSGNRDFRVLAALNHLHHEHGAALAAKCPILRRQPDREPGSFWMVRN